MKVKHLILLTAAAIIAQLLASCSMEPFVMSQKEEYTRSFIKTFGVIDPEQDWNMAQSASVTVDLGPKRASSVKIYTKVDDRYYLVADLHDVSGEFKVPVDVPEGSQDLMVKIDGKKYMTTLNSTVRTYGPSRASAMPTPTIAKSTDYVNYFNANQMNPLTLDAVWKDYYSVSGNAWRKNAGKINGGKGLIPEKKDNTNNDSIKQDFVIRYTDPVTLYPMYWQTSRTHTVGIYLIDDDGDPLDSSGNKAATVADIYKIPVYTSKGAGDMQVYVKYVRFDDNWDTNYVEGLKKAWVIAPQIKYYNGLKDSDITTKTWTSSNPAVATIDATNGNTTVVGNGQTKITLTVTTTGGDTHTYYKVLTVDWVTGSSEDPGELPASYDNYVIWDLPSDFLTQYGYPSGYKWDNAFDPTSASFQSNLQAWWDAGKALTINNPTDYSLCPADYKKYDISVDTSHTGFDKSNIYVKFTLNPEKSSGSSEDPEEDTPGESEDLSNLIPCSLLQEDGVWTNIIFGENDEYCKSPSYFNFESYWPEKEMLIRTKGVSIDLDGYSGYFGMYTECGYPQPLFSQRALNTGISPTEDEESYAAVYPHPESNRLFFSFEDWLYKDESDADLNDVVFRFDNVALTSITTTTELKETSSSSSTSDALSWLIAAEDLGSTDDFDFNDVVFSVTCLTTNDTSSTTTGEGEEASTTTTVTLTKSLTVQALAAGGTLQTYLHFNDGTTDYILGPNKIVENNGANVSDCEWHRWFNNAVSTQIVNTNESKIVTKPSSCKIAEASGKATSDDGTKPTPTITITTGSLVSADYLRGFSMSRYFNRAGDTKMIEGFYITVGTSASGTQMNENINDDDERMVSPSDIGEAPQMFLIPDIGHTGAKGWYWPTERNHILNAYPNFKEWINNASNSDWHKPATQPAGSTRPTEY